MTKGKVKVTFDMLKARFDKPLCDVATERGVCMTFIKKACRKNGIKRWPFRKVQAMRNRQERERVQDRPMSMFGSGSGSMVLRSCVFDACFGGEEFVAADAALSQQMAGNPSPASIHWATNPGLCLDVGGGQPQNGSVLQVWECITGHADMQFLLPMGGVGQIRWATFPKMCLDVAQGSSELGTRVQFWECEAGHRNMQFIVPAGGKGKIRWVADATLCLDVQDGGVAMGTHIQLWTCMGEGQANQEFEVAFTTPGA